MKIYGLIILLLLFLLSCTSKREVLYHIYTEGDPEVSNMNAEDVSEIPNLSEEVIDTSYFVVEEIPTYLDQEIDFNTDVAFEEKNWSTDTILDDSFIKENSIDVDTIQKVIIDGSKSGAIAIHEDSLGRGSLVNSSFITNQKSDTAVSDSPTVVMTNSATLQENDSVIITDAVVNQSEVNEATHWNVEGSETLTEINKASRDKKQLYIIDKDIFKPGLVFIEVDTIYPVVNAVDGKTIIVIRKLRSQLDNAKPEPIIKEVKIVKEVEVVKEVPVSQQENIYRLKYNLGEYKTGELEELNKVVMQLNSHPALVAVITSSTDATGSPNINLKLSKVRAETVRTYLIDKGISDKRIFIQYLGEKYASTPNDENERETLIVLK
jgi:outer membrane protein OmpA-like peptidoglycan-associated protein/PBP1b-binding outer membrane lipoprotein LpoB